jgi:hypothetical protein
LETEKLYSPLEFYFHDPQDKAASDDDGSCGLYDERYKIQSIEAFEYMDAIERAIWRDRGRMSKTRGMAGYLGGVLGEKVTAMFPSVELHGDALWCVTAVTLSEPLTSEELTELKDWWSGQLSDGWGESFEQREIMVGNCELYVVPWTSTEGFFIDTQREFDERCGIHRLTPDEMEVAAKDGDVYAVYTFDGFHGPTAFSRENYLCVAGGPLTSADTLDTIRAKHSLPPTSVIVFRKGDELTAWYVDTLAYSKMNGFFTEPAPALTPEPIREPDISRDKARDSLRERLILRLNGNLSDYFSIIRQLNDNDLAAWTFEIAAVTEAYHYMTELHSFETAELEYLLQFKAPLKVVADAFAADGSDDRSGAMWKIFDKEDALADDYELMPDPAAENALKQQLFERLDANLESYRDNIIGGLSKTDIFNMAKEIAAHYAVLECLKTGYDYKTGEVEYLLQFQYPLSLVAKCWPDLHELGGMNDIIGDILEDRDSHGHFARVIDAEHPASKESARVPADGEKASVLAQIRAAERAPKAPRADKPKHDRTDPER